MLKMDIAYDDLDGNTVVEQHYFNLRVDELTDLSDSLTSLDGGAVDLEGLLRVIIAKQDIPKMMRAFRAIVEASYGRRSADGRRFTKDKEYFKEFIETGAFEVFFFDLITDAGKAADFITGIIPKDLAEKAKQLTQQEPKPEEPKSAMELTREELLGLPPEEFARLWSSRS